MRNQITAMATAMAISVQRSWLLPVSSPGAIQAVDHGQAEAVQGNHEGKHYRIGIFCAEAQDAVEGQGRHREQARLEPEVGVERLFLVNANQHVGADADGKGEDQQRKFNVAARLGHGARAGSLGSLAVDGGARRREWGCRTPGAAAVQPPTPSRPEPAWWRTGVGDGDAVGCRALLFRRGGAGEFEVLDDPLCVVKVAWRGQSGGPAAGRTAGANPSGCP